MTERERVSETCACRPGYFLCPKAEQLWRTYFELRDTPEGEQARREYDEHMRDVHGLIVKGQGND